MKPYFNVDMYIDNKKIYASEPFTTTKELISICEGVSNIITTSGCGIHCEVVLYRDGGREYSYDFYNEYNYHRNLCELLTAVYYHCEFNVYCLL